MRRLGFPWANAHRIQDEHEQEVMRIESEAFAGLSRKPGDAPGLRVQSALQGPVGLGDRQAAGTKLRRVK